MGYDEKCCVSCHEFYVIMGRSKNEGGKLAECIFMRNADVF